MSKRITSKWTKDVKGAFGDNLQTQKGMKAEEMVYNYLKSIYDYVEWNVDNSKEQNLGHDFTFKKKEWRNSYTLDVKGNLKDKRFLVYIDEIKNKTNNRMVHIDTSNGFAVEYDRASMIKYIELNKHLIRTDKNNKRYFVGVTYDYTLKESVDYFRNFRIDLNKTKKKKDTTSYKLAKVGNFMTEDDYISRLNRTWYENYE